MAGRPKREFTAKDIEQIKVLARCHCPDSEIAAFMECGENTIKRHFGPELKQWREAGKSNIRAKQFKMAMDGNVTMLIWVGKQILGQSEKTELQIQKLPDELLAAEIKRRLAVLDQSKPEPV